MYSTTSPTKQQIANWKRQHEAVYALEVEGRTAYVRKPLPADLAQAHKTSRGDSLKMHENLLDNCWLAGPAELKTDDGLYLSAACGMGELVAELLPDYQKQVAASNSPDKKK